MELTIAIIIIAGLVLNGLGIIGCILPVLPGPLLSWLSLLLFLLLPDHSIGHGTLGITFGLMALVTAIDLAVPVMGAKRFGASREGMIGGAIGIVVGLFMFPPVGIILGPLIGTIVGDLIAGGTIVAAVNSGVGSLVGFLMGTAVKLAYCIGIVIYFSVKTAGAMADMVASWF
jgi:uncharacterized protein YqgC (DUF456 family)